MFLRVLVPTPGCPGSRAVKQSLCCITSSLALSCVLTVCDAANEQLVRAVICAGLYPNVAKLHPRHKPNR